MSVMLFLIVNWSQRQRHGRRVVFVKVKLSVKECIGKNDDVDGGASASHGIFFGALLSVNFLYVVIVCLLLFVMLVRSLSLICS